MKFIDENREEYGVEPICEVLPIAPSTYFEHRRNRLMPETRSDQAKRDELLKGKIQEAWDANEQVYGARKIWRTLRRNDSSIARCTVERLMRQMGLQGAIRGKAFKRTTIPDLSGPRPMDLVNRRFHASAPNQLWVADFTFVPTWAGFVYVAFVIDVFSRRIVGWRVATTMTTDLVLDAL